jgi:hypothetical protein
MKTSLKIGNVVEWVSQSGGYYGKVKRGKIVQVIPAGEFPDPGALRVLGAGFGMGGRRHKSYMVRVGNVAYWPRVCHLKIVNTHAQSKNQKRVAKQLPNDGRVKFKRRKYGGIEVRWQWKDKTISTSARRFPPHLAT